MIKFKSVFGSFLTVFASLLGDGEGWFAVGKVPVADERQVDGDESIWVLFSKTIDREKFIVRFPSEPVYRYTENGSMAIRSEKDGEIFELLVQKIDSDTHLSTETQFQLEGKWVHEHEIKTSGHIYRFQTHSFELDSPAHQEFISSFSAY